MRKMRSCSCPQAFCRFPSLRRSRLGTMQGIIFAKMTMGLGTMSASEVSSAALAVTRQIARSWPVLIMALRGRADWTVDFKEGTTAALRLRHAQQALEKMRTEQTAEGKKALEDYMAFTSHMLPDSIVALQVGICSSGLPPEMMKLNSLCHFVSGPAHQYS